MTITRRRYVTLAATLLVLAGCSPTNSPTPSPEAAIGSLPPSPSAGPTVAPSPTAVPSPTPDLGHAPFTVLLLGLDFNGRSDAIVVVGVDPTKQVMTFASIPRDTIDVPLPNGSTFTNQKINAYYNLARSDPARYPKGPAQAVADMVGGILDINIDYYATTDFNGFQRIVDAMGGVSITLPAAIVDPSYQVTPTTFGIRFKAGTQTLNGQRSLVFVRTRHSDNDFERQRRQQAFLVAAGKQLLKSPNLLAALLAARSNLDTDFPLGELPTVMAAMTDIGHWTIRDAVLGPRTYEAAASCPCGYALKPNVPAMRKLAADFFPWAVRP